MTTKRPDLYAILEIPPDATSADISHAYRALLRRHHPDTRVSDDDFGNADSDATLQQVLAAYTVLHDPARRADYDRQTKPQRPSRRPPQQPPPHHFGEHGQPDFIAGPVRWHQPPHHHSA